MNKQEMRRELEQIKEIMKENIIDGYVYAKLLKRKEFLEREVDA